MQNLCGLLLLDFTGKNVLSKGGGTFTLALQNFDGKIQ